MSMQAAEIGAPPMTDKTGQLLRPSCQDSNARGPRAMAKRDVATKLFRVSLSSSPRVHHRGSACDELRPSLAGCPRWGAGESRRATGPRDDAAARVVQEMR